MKIINNYDDWAKYYPAEESEIPEGVTLQMMFDYPFQLNARGEGTHVTFTHDAENTYFETSGAAFTGGGGGSGASTGPATGPGYAFPGLDYTGGGGGGATSSSAQSPGRPGGSGVVIIKYS